MNDVEKERGSWLLCAPISSLDLTKSVNYEYKINRVTFIDSKKLSRRRKRMGFPNVLSFYVDKFRQNLFCSENVVAIVRHGGTGKESKDVMLKLVKEELDLLSLSQLGYSPRYRNATPNIGKKLVSQCNIFMANLDTGSLITRSHREGKLFHLCLNEDWKNYQKNSFFPGLIKILDGSVKVESGWRKDLKKIAVLAGQSQSTREIHKAFLWNMIVIENLLTTQSKTKYIDQLPESAEAFIGWANEWVSDKYHEKIQELYRKRSCFVHDADFDSITVEDIQFTDSILFNILLNIVRHPSIFYSKNSLIEYSKKLQAERILGININSTNGSKVRPKTLMFAKHTYTGEGNDAI